MAKGQSSFQNENNSQFDFYSLSSTEGEAGDERVTELACPPVGQVGDKQQGLACASV